MPELSVVIPTYRRHAALRRTLAALRAQTAAPGRFEVIVVDDPVADEPAAVAAALGALGRPVTHLHRQRRGVSAARNQGWRAARAPVVLFIGDDILADPDLVAEHLAFHAAHPRVEAAVVGHVRWADELRVTSLMVWLDNGIQADFGRLDAGAPAHWSDFVTSNVSIKREMLERVAGFDEVNFPFLYEDTDLGLRLHEAGMELHYEPAARAQHLHRPTVAEWKKRLAATARAERRFVELHAALEPYFERRFRTALGRRRALGSAARALLALDRRGVLDVTPRVLAELDLYYLQRLGPAFLAEWDAQRPGAGA